MEAAIHEDSAFFSQAQDLERVFLRLKAQEGEALREAMEVFDQDRSLSDRVDADLFERMIGKGDGISHPDHIGMTDRLKCVRDGDKTVFVQKKSFHSNRRRLYARCEEDFRKL